MVKKHDVVEREGGRGRRHLMRGGGRVAKQDKGEGKEILRYAFPAFPVSPDEDPSVSLAP